MVMYVFGQRGQDTGESQFEPPLFEDYPDFEAAPELCGDGPGSVGDTHCIHWFAIVRLIEAT